MYQGLEPCESTTTVRCKDAYCIKAVSGVTDCAKVSTDIFVLLINPFFF